MNELSCFIGYDSKEDIAYRICKYSLNKRSSIKTDFTVACVPTGMNAGVLIFPLWVLINPTLASTFSFKTLKEKLPESINLFKFKLF